MVIEESYERFVDAIDCDRIFHCNVRICLLVRFSDGEMM